MDLATGDINGANIAHVSGEVLEGPAFSHKTYGETFYTFPLGILRHSGYEDRIGVTASERLLYGIEAYKGSRLDIWGQVRTYNRDENGRSRLDIVVFAREVSEGGEQGPVNDISLNGHICRKPVARISPLGRKICDIMLAVNRMYGKSDYIPCIAWGRNAVYTAALDVGDALSLRGRIQSRQYRKKTEDGQFTVKTAFEISIVQLES